MSTDTAKQASAKRNRWLVPVLCLGFGITYLIIGVAQRNWGFGIGGLVVMLGYGAVLVIFGRRNEAVGLLAGDQADERRQQLQQRAAASTGYILTVVLVAAMIWAVAVDSREAGLISGLCAVAGVSWIGSIVWLSRRG